VSPDSEVQFTAPRELQYYGGRKLRTASVVLMLALDEYRSASIPRVVRGGPVWLDQKTLEEIGFDLVFRRLRPKARSFMKPSSRDVYGALEL